MLCVVVLFVCWCLHVPTTQSPSCFPDTVERSSFCAAVDKQSQLLDQELSDNCTNGIVEAHGPCFGEIDNADCVVDANCASVIDTVSFTDESKIRDYFDTNSCDHSASNEHLSENYAVTAPHELSNFSADVELADSNVNQSVCAQTQFISFDSNIVNAESESLSDLNNREVNLGDNNEDKRRCDTLHKQYPLAIDVRSERSVLDDQFSEASHSIADPSTGSSEHDWQPSSVSSAALVTCASKIDAIVAGQLPELDTVEKQRTSPTVMLPYSAPESYTSPIFSNGQEVVDEHSLLIPDACCKLASSQLPLYACATDVQSGSEAEEARLQAFDSFAELTGPDPAVSKEFPLVNENIKHSVQSSIVLQNSSTYSSLDDELSAVELVMSVPHCSDALFPVSDVQCLSRGNDPMFETTYETNNERSDDQWTHSLNSTADVNLRTASEVSILRNAEVEDDEITSNATGCALPNDVPQQFPALHSNILVVSPPRDRCWSDGSIRQNLRVTSQAFDRRGRKYSSVLSLFHYFTDSVEGPTVTARQEALQLAVNVKSDKSVDTCAIATAFPVTEAKDDTRTSEYKEDHKKICYNIPCTMNAKPAKSTDTAALETTLLSVEAGDASLILGFEDNEESCSAHDQLSQLRNCDDDLLGAVVSMPAVDLLVESCGDDTFARLKLDHEDIRYSTPVKNIAGRNDEKIEWNTNEDDKIDSCKRIVFPSIADTLATEVRHDCGSEENESFVSLPPDSITSQEKVEKYLSESMEDFDGIDDPCEDSSGACQNS
jgi:hypothetical protein